MGLRLRSACPRSCPRIRSAPCLDRCRRHDFRAASGHGACRARIRSMAGALAMGSTATQSLSYDPATVEFDSLLRRLNPTNTRPAGANCSSAPRPRAGRVADSSGVLISEEIAHRQQTRMVCMAPATKALPRTRGQRAAVAQRRPAGRPHLLGLVHQFCTSGHLRAPVAVPRLRIGASAPAPASSPQCNHDPAQVFVSAAPPQLRSSGIRRCNNGQLVRAAHEGAS